MILELEPFFQKFLPANKERIVSILSNFKEISKGLSNTENKLGRRSNTTIFTFKYNEGAILAGDRRMSGGFFDISSDTETKLLVLTPFSAAAFCGFCSVIKYLRENMETACAQLFNLYGIRISPAGQAHYMERLLEDWFMWVVLTNYWAISRPILTAYDTEEERSRIFSFDEDGFSFEPKVVAGAGCGFECVHGLILDRWRPDLGRSAGIDLAIRAMFFSGILSHGVSDARLSPPQILTIDKTGVVWVPLEEVADRLNAILNENGGRKW